MEAKIFGWTFHSPQENNNLYLCIIICTNVNIQIIDIDGCYKCLITDRLKALRLVMLMILSGIL